MPGVASPLLQLDSHLLTWITGHRIGLLDGPMWLISVVGRGGMVWLAIGAALAIAKRLPPRGLLQLVLAILMASVLADQILKPLINRERPFAHLTELRVIGGHPESSSFPSGHSANAFAGATTLSVLVPGAQAVWWPLAVVIAFSRVYLGVHHPLDVVGGAIVGLASAAIALRMRWRSPDR